VLGLEEVGEEHHLVVGVQVHYHPKINSWLEKDLN
jgi:hypothetical protein